MGLRGTATLLTGEGGVGGEGGLLERTRLQIGVSSRCRGGTCFFSFLFSDMLIPTSLYLLSPR